MAQPIQLSFGVGFMNIIFTLDLLGQKQRQVGKRMQTKQRNAIAKGEGGRGGARGRVRRGTRIIKTRLSRRVINSKHLRRQN